MPYQRPTLPQLIDRIQTDIETRLPGSDPRLRRTLLAALARTQAGATHGLYGYQQWIADQIIPDTAEADVLDRWASWWGVPRLAAAPATGAVIFGGTSGAIIPAGTMLQRSDGAQYTTDADATLAAGAATATVTAVDGGQAGSTAGGSALTLVSPIAGVSSSAIVAAAGLTGGADTETDDALRARLRSRVQQRPQGGAIADYTEWALEVAGVTRVWVMDCWTGPGTVAVFFLRDNDASIIPDAAEVQAVTDHIAPLKQVGLGTDGLMVLAPAAATQNLTIQLNPNTAVVQAAVEAELADVFRREANVEDGAGSGKLLRSHLDEAISLATGEIDHVLVAPIADISPAKGAIATLGTITWQAL